MNRNTILLAALSLAALSGAARAANPRYNAPPPILVHLQFEGDPAFPSLTVNPTPGLARFNGANFGLSGQQRDQVVARIKELIEEDYRPFNMRFVTARPPGTQFFTWGIDDTAFTFSDSSCGAASGTCRLFGKAGPNPGAVDINGQSIFHPRHARTWAGSLTLTAASGSPSQPRLALGGTLPGGVAITIEHIAQALANNAAHEIGHLFGLGHAAGNCAGIPTCANERLMITMTEAVEATHDKGFETFERTALGLAIGRRLPGIIDDAVGAFRDPLAGLMWPRDGRVVINVASSAVGTTSNGRLSFANAQSYASSLDFLGYDDWRLPTALEPEGDGPCHTLRGIGDLIVFPRVTTCTSGEMGRLDDELVRVVLGGFFNFAGGSYWSTGSDTSGPWLYDFSTGNLTQSAPATALVWPVRQTATLVDNGDGTVTDTARRLMWMRDPGSLNRRTFINSVNGIPSLGLAGHTDWRLPRTDSTTDRTCEDPRVFSTGDSSSGCRQNELAHLMNGWGITLNNPGPFVMPAGGGPIWFGNTAPEIPNQPLSFSFSGGAVRSDALPATLGVVFPVRDLDKGDVPRGANIIVDPIRDVVVRFSQVTAPGVLSAIVQNLGLTRNFLLSTTAAFTGQAVVCLRNVEAPLFTNFNDLRVGLQLPNGQFAPLPLVNGYPDAVNRVICGRTTSLGTFRAVSGS
jgi:hypothetical protein